jgi:hypothetical protein
MALAKGRLGAADVTSGTLTDVYTVPARKTSTVSIIISNRTDAATNIRLALIKANTSLNVAPKDYVIFDLPTSAFVSNLAPVTYDDVFLGSGDTVAVYSSAEDVTVQVNGIEEDVSNA